MACARTLTEAGVEVQLLDRGRRLGGRMAVRTVDGHPVDTGASYFTVSDDRFAAVVADWKARGLAREWTDTFEVFDDLSSITGTGIGGRIRKQDVLEAAEAAKAPAPSTESAAPAASSTPAPPSVDVSAKRGTTEKMTRMRRLIATRMVESLQVSAQLTTVVEVDVTRISRLRDRAKAGFAEREGVKLSFLPFFALAAVEALKTHPVLNASVEGDSIVYHSGENLGIAVDTEKGLFVPVIQNAGDLNIAGLARKIGDLAARTRDNKVTPDELGGGTFTLTNTGSRGALFDTPIINQPQVAILGTGSVVKRAVVLSDADGGETIAIRSMVYLALSYDHRIVDGADAARFPRHREGAPRGRRLRGLIPP